MLYCIAMISVTILTKNSAATLRETLLSTLAFPEVVLFDTGSTDATLAIAREFPNVKIYQEKFTGFGPAHNQATSLASHDWILSVDSDEVLSASLVEEILKLNLDPSCVYSLLRDNYFKGKHVKWCGGWHPDWIIRLYNRTTSRFTEDAVHEKVVSEGLKVVQLRFTMRHTPYREIGDFLAKMQTYSTLFASQQKGKKSSSLLKALFHAWAAFFKSYILKKGFLGGKEGFIISAYNSHTAFYKYLKLDESNSSETFP